MTIRHHPSDETLLRLAAGTLPAGPALVVATHLGGCPACRAKVAQLEAIGGIVLAESAPAAMAPDALARALRAIDAGEGPARSPAAAPAAPARRRSATLPGGLGLPETLRDCEIGRWRWIGIGVRASTVTVPDQPGERLTLLRVGPGRRLPEHGHVGTEFTQILVGSYSDAFGRYLPGDLAEMGREDDHQPIVDPEGECICLAALEGGMRLTGLLGRMIQPFVRL